MANDKTTKNKAIPKALSAEDIFYQAEFFEHSSRLLGQRQGIDIRILGGTVVEEFPPKSGPTVHDGNLVIDQGTEIVTYTAIGGMADCPPTTTPQLVASAFCIELYLKSLHVLETGGVEWDHDLSALFEKLKPQTQESLKGLHDTKSKKGPTCCSRHNLKDTKESDLLSILKWHAKMFQRMRYCFEPPMDWHFHSLLPVQDTFREYFRQIKPGWVPLFRKRGLDTLHPTEWIQTKGLTTTAG